MFSARALFVITLALLNSFPFHRCEKECIIFKDKTDILHATRGSYVTVTFSVPSKCIPSFQRIDSLVVTNITSGVKHVYCQLAVQEDGQCKTVLAQDCSCSGRSREYSLNLQTSKTARCEAWRVEIGFSSSSATVSRSVKIFLADSSHLAPPKVRRLSLQASNGTTLPNSHLVVWPGSNVTASCYWEQGGPARMARLLRSNGSVTTRLAAKEKVTWHDGCLRHIDYVIENAQCWHTGNIRCEVTGATTNVSQMLLVKCAPQFLEGGVRSFRVTSSARQFLQFSVRAHQKRITFCRFVRRFELKASNASYRNNSWNVVVAPTVLSCFQPKLVGQVPDLTLRTWMTNVTSLSAGRWRVEMTNEGGTGSVDFFLKDRRETEASVTTLTAAAIGCVVFTVVIALVIFVLQWRRRDRRRSRRLSRRGPLPAPPGELHLRDLRWMEHPSDIDGQSSCNYEIPCPSVDLDTTDCDSWLIDRIYNDIRDHAKVHP